MKEKRIFALLLVMLLTLVPSTAQASEYNSVGTQESLVDATIQSSFTVSIPVTANIDAVAKTATVTYGAKAQIESGYAISIVPTTDKVEMKYTSNNVLNIKKNSVNADLVVHKKNWLCDELQNNPGSFIYSTAELNAPDLTAGTWEGTVQWAIELSPVTAATDTALKVSEPAYMTAIGSPEGKTEYFAPSLFEYDGVMYKAVSMNAGFLGSFNTIKKLHVPSTITVYPSGVATAALEEVDGDAITTITDGALSNKPNLKTVNFPALVTIANGAFYNCTALKEITLPNTLKTIGASAFNGSGITELVVPDTVTSIGGDAFKGIAHVTYTGSAVDTNGDHWGALSIN